jgi:hypothetical protein
MLSGDSTPSLSHPSRVHLRLHHKHESPHFKPYDCAFSDDSDSDSDNTSITSENSWKCSTNDDSLDSNINHVHKSRNHEHNLIYCGNEYNNYESMASLQDLKKLAFREKVYKSGMIDGNINVWIGMLTLHNFNTMACLKMST